MLVVDGPVNHQADQAVGHDGDRGAFGAEAPAAVYGAGQVAAVAAVLCVVQGAVQQGIGGLELGQGAHQAGVALLYAPLGVGDRDLARVMLGGAHGHHMDVGASGQAGGQLLVHYVLDAAADLGGAGRINQMAEGGLQKRAAQGVQERLFEIGHTDRLV